MKKLILFTIALFSISTFVFSQQWVQTAGTPVGGGVTDMVVTPNGTVIVACASFNWPTVQGGIRRSTDGGNTWQNVVNCYTARTLYLGSGGTIYASYWDYPSFNESIYRSTNDGVSWTPLHSLGASDNIFSITEKDNNNTLFIGTRQGVKRSTNAGSSWTLLSGMPAASWVRDLAVAPDGEIAAATTNGVFISTNNGTNWSQATGIPAGDTVTTLEFVEVDTPGDGLYIRLNAGSNNGNLYESMLASSYIQFLLLHYFSNVSIINIFQIRALNSNLRFAIARQQHFDNSVEPGVYQSANNGSNWILNNEGLPSNPLVSVMSGNHPGGNNFNAYLALFENSNNGAKIYSRSFLIGIQQISSEVPDAFSLSQNYPNPFNPMTKIKFNVTKASNVNITVFDVLGRHITTLVNEKLGAGSYETEWNANNMPGGVYFYRIEAEDFTETKKLILVK